MLASLLLAALSPAAPLPKDTAPTGPAPRVVELKPGTDGKIMITVVRTETVKLPVAALQFVLAHPAVASVIPGAAKPSEVQQNVAALSVEIPAAFWADLKAQGLIASNAPVPGAGK